MEYKQAVWKWESARKPASMHTVAVREVLRHSHDDGEDRPAITCLIDLETYRQADD